MAGIRITDLPEVDEIKNTDQLLIARGETTRKAWGTALVTKEYIRDLITLIDKLSSSTLNTSDSEQIAMFYDPLTKQLSAEITGVIPQGFGGTGYNSYTENQILIGDAFGILRKVELVAGPHIALSSEPGQFTISNINPHLPTDLSATYVEQNLVLYSSTGEEVTLSAATPTTAGVMSSQDKYNLNGLFRIQTNSPLLFTSNLTATSQLLSGNKIALLSSENALTVELPPNANSGSQYTFINAGTNSVEFVEAPGVKLYSTVNPTYKKISNLNGIAVAHFKNENEWYLTGDLISVWDKILTGPDATDDEQKVGIFTNGSYDKLYFKSNWNKTNTSFASMVIQISGVPHSVVDFTEDRIGTQFGYKIGPSLGGSISTDLGPTFFGTFASGNVNLT
jgi:hypothetical protein